MLVPQTTFLKYGNRNCYLLCCVSTYFTLAVTMIQQEDNRKFRVQKCPNEQLSFSNRAICNPQDFPPDVEHILVNRGSSQFILTIEKNSEIFSGFMALNLPQRKWSSLSLNEEIAVVPFHIDAERNASGFLCNVLLEVDFMQKKSSTTEPYNSDDMAKEFIEQFSGLVLMVGETLAFYFDGKKLFHLLVKKLLAADVNALKEDAKGKPLETTFGKVLGNTVVQFEKREGSDLNLIGKSKGYVPRPCIINADWDFYKMGIGGLKEEFAVIWRRAFSSRVCPPEIFDLLDCQHIKGILLFGPPGTGKTLIAREIAKLLNARNTKIVNGPQILDKFVGESEANVRRLFADAEEEEKRLGRNSGLHVIIFDEIDSIFKARGTTSSSSLVNDTIVTQMLSKMDGVDRLNNILIIGITNRKDLIDEALLRPGRFEVHLEIKLPDAQGRLEILQIHTNKMARNDVLSDDVDLKELASVTKHFSGADIAGLVRAAQSRAMCRFLQYTNNGKNHCDDAEKVRVTKTDFFEALNHDLKPILPSTAKQLEPMIPHGIIEWGQSVLDLMKQGTDLIEQLYQGKDDLKTILFEGGPKSGKTALAANLAKSYDFQFVTILTPQELIGLSCSGMCSHILEKFKSAECSGGSSCIIVDEIENFFKFSNSSDIVHTFLLLLKNRPPIGNKLFVICTSSERNQLQKLNILDKFQSILHVPNLTQVEEISIVLKTSQILENNYIQEIVEGLKSERFSLGIKKLFEFVDEAKKGTKPVSVQALLRLIRSTTKEII